MADQRPTPTVTIPKPEQDQPGWRRVGIFAAVGLVIGIGWPTVAGIRIGPDVPGRAEIIKGRLRSLLKQYFYFIIRRRPTIIPIILEL